MTNSDTGTSSGSARGGKCQVFLNFCGRDTRDGFTNFLHRDLRNNGIHAFMDDEELRVGEEIGGELLRAIDDSQIYIPIFSQNYAGSKWCLRELARMVDNTSNSKEKKILPIFYYVKPNDVDLKTALYSTAIKEHKEEHEKKQQEKFAHEVESWEEALKKVDQIKGWVLRKGESQAELVDLVVKVVLQELKIRYKSMTKDLVGLDYRVAEVLKLLDVDCSDEVRLLGIHGMGGIGKTTIAKVVYNELSSRFGKCCAFLDDVRETLKKEGLVSLQKKLLRAIDSSGEVDAINDVDYRRRIEATLGSKKVLIVLDDVDEEKMIENLFGQYWLHLGTRIIITTRIARVLEFTKQRMVPETKKVNSDLAIRILSYEMVAMNFDDALKLFKRHAFLEGSLAMDFDYLSRDIVSTTECLPLALEVMGSSLCGEPKEKWEKTLNELKKIPDESVQAKLMISYKDLNYRQHDIFLDVACFFINEDITNAIYMWEACGINPELEIDVLVRKSLIKIKHDNKFWMHDLLKDLGREIVHRQSLAHVGKRSRLWTSEQVLDLVKTEERFEDVEALDLWERGWGSYISISPGSFESLRFLRLSNMGMYGDFIVSLPKLRWISWRCCFQRGSGPSMHSENLVVLELFDNHFTDDSKVWDLIKMATKLKNLALVECRDITRTPNLSKCLDLERLTFDHCGRLKEIHSSIGKLKCLLDLNITRCGLIERVPDEIGGLVKLERFSLKGCDKVSGLPTAIGDLTSLRKLDLSYTGITSLPESIEKLWCLSNLCLKDTKIGQLPNSIGKLTSLCTLDLSKQVINEIIDLWELPKAIGMLHKLEELYLGHCNELVGKVPDEIGDLSSLRVLNLCWTGISRVPGTINRLSCLSTLDLTCCEITELPELPASLVHLHVESSSLEVVPCLSKLTNLVELVLSDGSEGQDSSNLKHTCHLGWIGRLSKLKKLKLCLLKFAVPPMELGLLSLLEDLTLLGLDLQPLEQLPPSLLSLELDNWSWTGPPQSNLGIPSKLTLRLLRPEEIQLHGFLQLQDLHLSGCVLESLIIPSRLRILSVCNCPNMTKIQVFGMSASLEELEISECQSIGRIVLFGEGGSLGVLDQSESSLSESTYCSPGVLLLPDALKKLKVLILSMCENLLEIQVIGTLLSLQHIFINNCAAMEKLTGTSNSKNLRRLFISDCSKLCVVEGLDKLEFLTELDVDTCPSLETLLDISSPKIPDECLIQVSYCRESLNSGGCITFERYKRIPQQAVPQSETNKSMEEMEDEAGEQAADMETSDRNYAIAAVQNVVGIDDHVKNLTDLLEMEVNDEVHIIGIYGTDGIGKTTLAKVVYNRISSCFDSCSFLAEVEETTRNPRDDSCSFLGKVEETGQNPRGDSCSFLGKVEETGQNPRGIQFLQAKLISDILERDREDPSFDETIEIFLDIFREMKVLIVVDDVEKQSHLHAIVGDRLHWFGPGSRIIVTSQNKEILKEYDPEKARTYTVGALDDGQVFELFCKHAFRMQSSIPDYDGLANRIVKATEKLPLAVEVVGSFLRGKSIQEWEKMEKSMKQFTMRSEQTTVGLEEILDICYKELDQQQKDIFLDIAFFISGVDARIASYMWPNCYPSSGCILMPLAKIGENNELQMHRLLRCVGKRILNQEGSGDPIDRKFYIQDIVPKAISREKGMENVEALCFDFTAGHFQSMPDIRFLKLDNAKVSGNFEGAFASLRWLCWQRCPLDFSAENFLLTELVILDLSWSKVTEEWGGWSEIKMKKLKVLNLTGCSDLLFTPDFSGYKYLEILILERCCHLMKLDPSIGNLKRLVHLNLKFCSQLNGLPVELGCTTALKELFIDGTSVRLIPISIGNLKQLEILSGLNCFQLTHLPSSICYLTALSEFLLEGAKISELPSSLGKLLELRRLSLRECRWLDKLPYSIGEMGSLEELDISATSISELPDSIRNLKSLRVLRMDSSFIRAFPGEIGNLTKLEELHASWCRSLKGAISCDIEGLHRLRSLTLGHSGISSLPPEIFTIPGLQALDLIQCNEIEELPKLPRSLICLRVSSKRMKAMLFLGNLKKLEELCLSDGDQKARRPPSTIEGLEGLEGLKALKRLDISNCKIRNLNGIGQLTSLSSLILSDCDDLSSLDLSNLKSLKVLEIKRCKMIHHIEGLAELTSLEKLKVSECPAENSERVQNALKDIRARFKRNVVHRLICSSKFQLAKS